MENKGITKSQNSIITGLMTAAVAVVMGLLYAYYYDLNDDVLMKDILSGVFTGEPCGHNIQMLYPISLVLSLFYRVFRNADCYGIYLILCQYISLFFLVRHVAGVVSDAALLRLKGKLPFQNEIIIRVLSVFLVYVVILAVMPGHLVIVQYTFTVAMMCAAAAVLFSEHKDAPAVIFVIVAFLTRSEMTLLMLPFVLLILFFRIFDENEKGLKGEVLPVIAIAVGLGASLILNFAGYSSKDWKRFNSFFDSRTDIYDFYQIPDYEENREFYNSIDLKKSEYELLVNYNFGLDSEIDADKMARVASYAKSIRTKEGLFPAVKRVIPQYLYRLRNIDMPVSYEYPMTDSPWNIITGLLYLACFVLTYLGQRKGGSSLRNIWNSLWRIVLLFGGRTLLWMYILVRGRDPIRITHSLYLLEITVLLMLSGKMLTKLLAEMSDDNTEDSSYGNVAVIAHVFSGFCLIVLLAVCFSYIPAGARVVGTECKGREEYNRAYEELGSYFKEHGDKFFFVDVYTSVSYEDNGYTYSQRMLHDTDNNISNSVIMGGWASKSPAEKDKLLYFGFDEPMEDAVFEDKSFIVSDIEDDMAWLFDYYFDKGRYVTLSREDEVAGEFAIWKLTENAEE